jgi:hypothetical protein
VTLVLAAAWLAGSCQYAVRDARRGPPPVLVQPAPGPGEVARLGARSRWWNYYRRSLEYAQAGDWLRAAWDLEITLGRRPGVPFGEDQERRRAKIYGLHYLDDYFPHRELGICLFRLGQFEAAEQELLTSLQMLPSSRAKFYLNEVRQGRLQSAAVPGSSAFTIDLLPSGEPFLTNRLHVDLRGTISSPAFVSRVSVNGRPLFVELAAAAYALAESVPVVPGEQQVRIEAADLQGRQASISRTIIVDLSGPEIAVSRSTGGSPGEVLVTVVDDRELASVEIDGSALTLAPAQASVASRVVLGGRAGVEVIAVDRAGNRTVLGSTAAPRQQAALEGAVSDWLLAGAAGIRRRSGESAEPVLLAQAAPPAAAAQPDTLPPVLLLSPPLLPRLVVTRDTYVVDLQIEDGGGVAALSTVVNGRQDTKEFQPADADVRRLTRTLALVPGQNEVEIVARDRAGNTTRLKALIERREDPAWREDLRVTSQVLPPPPAAPTLTPAVDLYPSLLGALVGALDSQPPRLNLVERDPAVMRQLMIEHALVEGSLADKTRAIRKGKLRTSDWCLVPRVTVWPGQDNFDLFIEVVDVADTSILLSTDIHFTSADRDHVHAQLRGLVAKLEQQLPRLTAPVAAQTGKSVVLPLGAEQQVSRGMYVLFIAAAAAAALDQDPVTWRDGAWVQGRVTRVLPNSCRVEVEPAKALKLLKANDLALFR